MAAHVLLTGHIRCYPSALLVRTINHVIVNSLTLLAEINYYPVRSTSSTSLNTDASTVNARSVRGKDGPPLSYPRNFYPPPSTASLVQQLIGNGVTLAYDSSTEPRTTRKKTTTAPSSSALPQSHVDKRAPPLTNANSTVRDRPLPSNAASHDYETSTATETNVG